MKIFKRFSSYIRQIDGGKYTWRSYRYIFASVLRKRLNDYHVVATRIPYLQGKITLTTVAYAYNLSWDFWKAHI
jgi:hypothetical protein